MKNNPLLRGYEGRSQLINLFQANPIDFDFCQSVPTKLMHRKNVRIFKLC